MEFMREFPDDEACLNYLWRTRYAPDGETAHCPKCDAQRDFKGVQDGAAAPIGRDRITVPDALAGELFDRLRREAVECLDGELEVLRLRVLELRVREASEALDEEHDRGDARAGNLGRIV
jgi:hypothetical protein